MYAGAVRGGGTAAGHGDVWQRRQVMQAETVAVDIRCQPAVGDPGADGNSRGRSIDRYLIEMLEGDLLRCTVRDPVEGVARTERPKLAGAFHGGLALFHIRWRG